MKAIIELLLGLPFLVALPVLEALGLVRVTRSERMALCRGIISSATANPVLSGLFQKFLRSAEGFVGRVLAPINRVGEQTAQYFVWDADNLLSVPRLKARAPGSPYPRTRGKVSDDQYFAQNWGVEEKVPDEDIKRYGTRFSAQQAALRRVRNIVVVNHELRVKDLYGGASVPASTVSTKWDQASSDPIGDVDTGKGAIRAASGMNPNTLVLSQTVFDVLKTNASILAKFQNVERAILTKELLQAIFGVSRVEIAGQIINGAADGQAVNPSEIWGDSVYLAYVDPTDDIQVASAAKTLLWTAWGSEDAMVESYYERNIKSEIERCEHYTDEKLTSLEMAYRLDDVLT